MTSTCPEIETEEVIEEQKSVGAVLKEARLVHDVRDLNVIARELCISTYLLEALEQDNIGAFPSACYAIGFLKNYSDYLGLDTGSLATRFEEKYKTSGDCVVLDFPEIEKTNGISLHSIAGIATLCIAIIVGVWTNYDKLSSSEMFEAIDPTKIISTNNQMTSEGSQIIETENAIPVAASDIKLQASNDVWVRISDQSGSVVMERILEKGQDFIADKASGLNLMTNNAAALSVMVGSTTVHSLGEEGEIVEGLILDEKKLLELSFLD